MVKVVGFPFVQHPADLGRSLAGRSSAEGDLLMVRVIDVFGVRVVPCAKLIGN